MGTREVYEERLRTGNLYHDPTIKPGLGSARCPRCLSLLNPASGNAEWRITPVLHDFTTGLPPLLMFSAASAAFGGFALPKFAQLTVTSYYAASSASHHGISLLTRHIEEEHTAGAHPEKLS
nr:Transmembrane protein [Ipomoea batatas]GMC99924.1 Transmembrane protein [Ipomoea batatas]GMD81053.1 Transmembrane protein [Ipomoea batatas]